MIGPGSSETFSGIGKWSLLKDVLEVIKNSVLALLLVSLWITKFGVILGSPDIQLFCHPLCEIQISSCFATHVTVRGFIVCIESVLLKKAVILFEVLHVVVSHFLFSFVRFITEFVQLLARVFTRASVVISCCGGK